MSLLLKEGRCAAITQYYSRLNRQYEGRDTVDIPTNLLILNASQIDHFHHTPKSKSDCVYLIKEGNVSSLVGGVAGARSTYSLHGKNTTGVLLCEAFIECSLNLGNYARHTSQNMIITAVLGQVKVSFPYMDIKLRSAHVTRLVDRQNMSDVIYISALSSLKVLHVSSKNRNCDRVFVSTDFVGQLTFVLTGSKVILNRASKGQYVYMINRRKANMRLALPRKAPKHILVFDKDYQTIRSISATTCTKCKKFTSRLQIVVSSIEFDDTVIVTINKTIHTQVQLIFETFVLTIFANFVILKSVVDNKSVVDEIDWTSLVSIYTIVRCVPDHKSIVNIDYISNNKILQNYSSLVLAPDLLNSRIRLSEYLETHLIFTHMDQYMSHSKSPWTATLTISKETTESNVKNTIIHLKRWASYAQTMNETIKLFPKLTQSEEPNKTSYMVHVTCVTEYISLKLLDLVLDCPESLLSSFLFFVTSHHPMIVSSNSINGRLKDTLSMKPVPVHLGSTTELIVLVEDYLEPFTEIRIDKSVGYRQEQMIFLVIGEHLLVVNELPKPLSILLVDFYCEFTKVLKTLRLKFNNATLEVKDIQPNEY